METLTDLLFWLNPIPAWIVDAETSEFLAVNDAAVKTYGYTREEFSRMTPVSLCVPSKTGFKNMTRDGAIIDVEESTSARFWYEGRAAQVTMASDVTERLQLTESVQSAHAMLASAAQIASLSSWTTDVRTRRTEYSAECSRLFDLQLDHVSPHELLLYCLTDGQPDAYAKLLEAATGPVPTFDLELKLRTLDGDRWYHARLDHLDANAHHAARMTGVLLDIDDRHSAVEQLERIVFVDRATGLPNHAALMRELESVWLPVGSGLAILKLSPRQSANDQPEELFAASYRRLASCFVEGTYVARFSEQRFVVLFPTADGADAADAWARHAVRLFDDPIAVGDALVAVRPRVGIARATSHGDQGRSLLAEARLALDAAETRSEDVLSLTPIIRNDVQRRAEIDRHLRGAIARGELHLCYQPVVSAHRARVVAVEALLRWNSEALGVVSPNEFIPIAEESGYIARLGAWVIERAFSEYRQLGALVVDRPRLMINVSPVQLRERDFFVNLVERASANGLQASDFGIELTECALLEDFHRSGNKMLRLLRKNGIRVALDDFGTGYSSLNYLASLPFDELKIDRSFVAEMRSNSYKRAAIRAIIEIAKELKLGVIGEGVERPEEFAMLTDMGCGSLQGFLISRPIPIQALAPFIASVAHEEQALRVVHGR